MSADRKSNFTISGHINKPIRIAYKSNFTISEHMSIYRHIMYIRVHL